MNLLKGLIDDDIKINWVYNMIGLPNWVNWVEKRLDILREDYHETFGNKYQGKPYNGYEG